MIRLVLSLLLLAWLAPVPAPAAPAPLVLFDEGHGQRFVIERQDPLDLSGLAQVFRVAGADVQATRDPLTRETLAPAAVVVISGPFRPLTQSEIDALVGYLYSGGRLALMLHIPMPVTTLLMRLNLYASNGIIRDPANTVGGEPQDFWVTDLRPHPLNQGLARFAVYGCWALQNANSRAAIVARTEASSWVDLNRNRRKDPGDPQQVLGVAAVGSMDGGRYVVFGDDAIFQNRFLREENHRLAENLANWLLQPAATP